MRRLFLDQFFSVPPSSTAVVGAGGFQLGLILDERRAVFTISEVAALNMSRLSGASASAVAELVPVIPLQWIQEFIGEGTKQLVWEKYWLNVDSSEWQVAKITVQDVGEAMQFLKPIYLAAAAAFLYSESSNMMLHKPDAPS